jgi:multicomponent Na+:H+ antiporter subunit E
MNYYLRVVIPLTIIYLLVTNNYEISNIVVGLLIALALAVLVKPQTQAVKWQSLPSLMVAVLQYTIVLIWDVFLNGLKVAYIVLTPSLQIMPGIVAIPSGCKTEVATALSAFAITAAPGEMVLETDDDGIMYTHCLIAVGKDDLMAQAQARRRQILGRIFA